MDRLFLKPKVTNSDHDKLQKLLGSKEITFANILSYIPFNYEIITKTDDIKHVDIGAKIIANVTVERHIASANFGHRFSKKTVYQIIVSTDDGMPITLVFFKIFPSQIQKMAVGTRHCVEGKLEAFGPVYKITHPKVSNVVDGIQKNNDNFTLEESPQDQKIVRPVYRMTAELSQKKIYDFIDHSLSELAETEIVEWGGDCIKTLYLSDFKTALNKIHRPDKIEEVGLNSNYRKRLVFDELLASQISLQIARQNVADEKHSIIKGDGSLTRQVIGKLPFELTDSQSEVIAEIFNDQACAKKMFRLLQGDVGSGKTVVCLLACLNAIECGKKAVIMAPTTILAMQHAKFISDVLFGLGVEVAIITGRTTNKQYKDIQNKMLNGEIDILIGTHSVINQDLEMKNIGIIVVDEQHRFGVKQRLDLFKKAPEADILMMTATPIPRTLAMMHYGDIDISVIKHKPAMRKPIDTRVVSIGRYAEILESFNRGIVNGEKIYWVCPMIEESEKDDLANTYKRKAEFEAFFGVDNVGMIHGKMKEKERDEILIKFLNNHIKILVATTVIEVGINVPDATIIAIEHADRFGLSQLHQLRGRVGRSDKASYCLLLYDDKITESGKKRLHVIKDTEDGFEIAKEDLKMRGTGDLIGTKQSGFGDFKVANLATDLDMLQYAVGEAKKAMQDISNPKYLGLLQFFGYDEAIDLLRG